MAVEERARALREKIGVARDDVAALANDVGDERFAHEALANGMTSDDLEGHVRRPAAEDGLPFQIEHAVARPGHRDDLGDEALLIAIGLLAKTPVEPGQGHERRHHRRREHAPMPLQSDHGKEEHQRKRGEDIAMRDDR